MSDEVTRPPKSRAQLIAEDAELCDCLFLVINGIPFDVAFSLDEDERLAYCVVIGEHKGAEFDWNTKAWRPMRT